MKNFVKGDRVLINTKVKACSFLPKVEATVTFLYKDNLFDCIEDSGKVHEAIAFDNAKKIKK